MTKKQHDADMRELNVKLLDAINALDPDGSKSQALGNVLLAYGIRTLVEVHGNDVVARHLASLSERFAAGGTFDEIATLN